MHYQYDPKNNAKALYTITVTTKDKTYDECECCGITCNIICCAVCCDDIGEEEISELPTPLPKSELKQFVTDSLARHTKNKPTENFSIKIEITAMKGAKKTTFTDMKNFDEFITNGTVPTVSAAAKPPATAANRA